jgi:serine/threonine-protein kinase RsbW
VSRSDLTVAARLEELPRIRAFVEETCRKLRADEMQTFGLKLAVDEAVTNVAVHGYQGQPAGAVTVGIEADRERLVVTICDRGRSFPPENAPPPDLESESGRRKIGGLGWHLIRSVVDTIDYATSPDGENRLTLVKRRGTAQS